MLRKCPVAVTIWYVPGPGMGTSTMGKVSGALNRERAFKAKLIATMLKV